MEKPEENYALARWSKLATKVIKSWWQYIPWYVMKMVLYFSGFPLKNTVNQSNCEENIRQVQTGEYSTKYLTSTLQNVQGH